MASKSLQQEPEKAEVIEEALDLLDQTLDRVKVLYEQYFLGIQKQPPQFLHTDVERKLRDIAQLQIRNTALRYRFVTLQQKFGSYNAYWRRTLRQIENGTYLRNLSKLTRMAAQTGEEIPEEILAAMPKRMREQVRRDREAAIAIAARRKQVAEDDDEPEMTIDGLPDNQSDPFDPPTDLRRKTAKTAGGAHVVDEADGDLDLDAFFAEMEKNPTRPPPIANPALARARTRERDRDKTGNLPVIGRTKTHSSSPSGAHAVVADPTRPKRAPTAQPTPPRGEPVVSRPGTAPIVGRSDTDFDLDPPTDLRRKPQPPPQVPRPAPLPRPAPVQPQQTTQVPRPVVPPQQTQAPRPAVPPQTASIPRPAPSQQTTPIPRPNPAQTTPFSRPIPAIPAIPAIPPVPERPQTSQTNITFKSPMAPSQVTRPNPIIAGSAANQQTMPVETLSGPFPAAKPAPQPNVPRPAARAPAGRVDPGARTPPPQRVAPPPGMTDADVNALYAKYVKAKEMVGQTAGPGAYGKLLQTINAQAPKIMEQYKAKGVDFSVVVKDNQVIIRAKPKP